MHLITLLLEFSCELSCPFLGTFDILIRRLEDDRECVERDADTGLHLEQTTLDVLDTLTGPAVGAKDTSEETAVDDGVDAGDDIPDGWEGLTNKSGRTKENTLCLTNGCHDLVERSIDDVVHLNVNAVLFQCSLDGAGEGLSELVGSGVGDDNERVARTLDGSGPVTIELNVELHVLTKDGTVAAADGVKVYILELGQTVQDVLLEGAKDAVKVVLVCTEHVLLHLGVLGDLIVEDERIAVVGTEEVTGDDGLELRDVGNHGIRPVEEGTDDELEGVATDVDGSGLVGDLQSLGELLVADELNVPQGGTSSDDCGLRVLVHQQSECTTVIRLSMIQNNIVDLLISLQNSLDPLFKLGKVSLLDGLEEDVCLLTLQQEAVVGCSKGGCHDNIKVAKLRMKSTNPVQVFPHKKGLILSCRHCKY